MPDKHGGQVQSDAVLMAPIDSLAFRANVDRSTLEKILGGKRQGVMFDVADRIVCALGAVGLFHDGGPLSQAYWSETLEKPQGGGQTKTQIESDTCPRGHERAEFSYRRKNGKLACRQCDRDRARANSIVRSVFA